MTSVAHALYFWFSLIFLIARTLAVSLYSAAINDESKGPLSAFRAVPKDSWCLEVRRFSDEVTNDVVALSGMKFFYLTRKLVLSVSFCCAISIDVYRRVLHEIGTFRLAFLLGSWNNCYIRTGFDTVSRGQGIGVSKLLK